MNHLMTRRFFVALMKDQLKDEFESLWKFLFTKTGLNIIVPKRVLNSQGSQERLTQSTLLFY